MEIDQTTDTDGLVGNTYTTEHFDSPFTVVTASQAPELNAVAYSARDDQDGYLFLAFQPYGKELMES